MALPIYVQKLEQKTFINNNSTAHKALSKVHGKRIMYCNEIPKGKNLNAELLKDVADGVREGEFERTIPSSECVEENN